MTEYTLTMILQDSKFRHLSTRYDSLINARKAALNKWNDDFKAIVVMKASKYISIDPVGWIEYTDRGFIWKVKKSEKGKVLNWDGTFER